MWKEYRDAIHVCREKICVAKAQLELKLAMSVGDNKIVFFRYVNRKRRTKENIGPLLDGEGLLTDNDIGKAETLNAFFASVFNANDGLRDPGCPEIEGWDGGDDKLPTDPERVRDLLLHLDPYKSMGPDGIHPRVLKELADVIAEPLSIIFQRSWEFGEVPVDWKLANVPIYKKGQKEDPSNYRQIGRASCRERVSSPV